MGVCCSPAGLFVQRLVVPQAHAVRFQQCRCRGTELRMKRERTDAGMVFPQTHALDKRLLVKVFIEQCAVIVGSSMRHGGVDLLAEMIEFLVREEVFDQQEAVGPETLDLRLTQSCLLNRCRHSSCSRAYLPRR